MPSHRHIVMRGLGKASEEFEAYGGGNTHRPSPVTSRQQHAERIRGDLAAISETLASVGSEQAAAQVPAKERGVTVTVLSREGQELAVGESRRANSPGMKLLNVKRMADTKYERGRDRATLFLTKTAINSLETSLGKYEAWANANDDDPTWSPENGSTDDSGGRRPQNFWLFESADSFRPSRIEDLWTDTLENFPRAKGEVEWEVWVRTELAENFRIAIDQLGLEMRGQPTSFLDIEVHNVVASRQSLARLIERSAAIVELRGASSFIAEHADLPPDGRLQQASAIAAQLVPAPAAAPWVTLLDTGVNRANPLLAVSLPADRCRSVVTAWNALDGDGHGTKMAGVALLGDITYAASISSAITLEVGLESVAVFSPGSAVRLPGRDAIYRGVMIAEQAASHPRVYCLAATAVGEAEDGRPTATSTTVDGLAFNDGKNGRLFCVAVGNVQTSATEPYQTASYSTLNEEHGIQSPAQALNVLAVGAYTRKCSGQNLVANVGGLSPRSRTAQSWDMRYPHKPDILMEGGNHALDPGGLTSRPHIPDMVATTSRDPVQRPITFTGDTSAATAAAANLAARLMARYPAMRPETVRGLLVHSAEWSAEMKARYRAMISAGVAADRAATAMLNCFGWGVPDEERLFWSAGNALTLVAEDELRPYEKLEGKSVTLKEMKSFKLPWPDEALRALGRTEVELRATLSYFIQPDLHSAGLERGQLYPSHRLRLDFQRFEESEERTHSRINKAVYAPYAPDSEDNGWLLGANRRSRGTLNHDIWSGPAYQLVGRRLFTVSPIRGWWANASHFAPADIPVRFSLIVSIRTPANENDLVIEARAAVPAGVLLDVPSVIRV